MVQDGPFRYSKKQGREDNDDALLVISLNIGDCTVQWILVDTGSIINALFREAVTHMGIPVDRIKPHVVPLIGFTGSRPLVAALVMVKFHQLIVTL